MPVAEHTSAHGLPSCGRGPVWAIAVKLCLGLRYTGEMRCRPSAMRSSLLRNQSCKSCAAVTWSQERPGEGPGGLQATAANSNDKLTKRELRARAQCNTTSCPVGCQWPGSGQQRTRQAPPEGAPPDAWAGHGVRRDWCTWPRGAWGHCPAGAGSRCILSCCTWSGLFMSLPEGCHCSWPGGKLISCVLL